MSNEWNTEKAYGVHDEGHSKHLTSKWGWLVDWLHACSKETNKIIIIIIIVMILDGIGMFPKHLSLSKWNDYKLFLGIVY